MYFFIYFVVWLRAEIKIIIIMLMKRHILSGNERQIPTGAASFEIGSWKRHHQSFILSVMFILLMISIRLKPSLADYYCVTSLSRRNSARPVRGSGSRVFAGYTVIR